MAEIKPITLDEGDLTRDSRGQYKILDDFIAVVDGRKNLYQACISARQLAADPHFQDVTIIRDSKTLEKSRQCLFNSFYNQKFHQQKRGTVLPWPENNKFLIYQGESILNPDKTPFKTIGNFQAKRLLGPDYFETFNVMRLVNPEYLSWDLRGGVTIKPGGLHFDHAYEDATHTLMDKKLPKTYANYIKEHITRELPGSITVTIAVRGGGTIVTKCAHNDLPEQQFEEYGQDSRQAQDGDITVIRGSGWPNPQQLASYHCPSLHPNGHDIAVASSWASYLAPGIIERYGPDHLKRGVSEELEPG